MSTSDPAPSTPEAPAPQFRKTKQGKWAVMGPVETIQTALAGDGNVKVLKKSGDWSDFTVVSMGRPFDVDGVDMVYGYDTAGDEGDTPSGSAGGGSARSSSAGTSQPRQSPATPPPPPRDDSEPLPQYQGGPEDEWQGEF